VTIWLCDELTSSCHAYHTLACHLRDQWPEDDNYAPNFHSFKNYDTLHFLGCIACTECKGVAYYHWCFMICVSVWVCRPVCWIQPWALLKRLNRSRCCLGCGLWVDPGNHVLGGSRDPLGKWAIFVLWGRGALAAIQPFILTTFCNYVTAVCRGLESLHRKELDNNRLLRQQLSAAQSTARQLNDVQKEAAVLKKKVTELQNVQSVINGELLWCSIYVKSF